MRNIKIFLLILSLSFSLTTVRAEEVPFKYCWQLVKMAEEGNAEAQGILGFLYYLGDGVPESIEEAAKWWHKAAENGFPEAQLALGNLYFDGEGVNQSYEEAVKWYRKAAPQISEAKFILGECYEEGLGVTRSIEEAMKIYYELWEEGDLEDEMLDVVVKKIEHYNKLAAKEYAKAAKKGDPVAQHQLGMCYYNGEGVPQNDEEAVKWILKSADQGYSEAIWIMGWFHQYGHALEKDPEKAMQWYSKAADLGDVWGLYKAALFNFGSEGYKVDEKAGMAMLEKAAQSGMPEAIWLCGILYYDGTYEFITEGDQVEMSTDIDYPKAVQYLKKAWENPEIEYKSEIAKRLSACYRFGRGVTANEKIADIYLYEAAQYGDQDSLEVSRWLLIRK